MDNMDAWSWAFSVTVVLFVGAERISLTRAKKRGKITHQQLVQRVNALGSLAIIAVFLSFVLYAIIR